MLNWLRLLAKYRQLHRRAAALQALLDGHIEKALAIRRMEFPENAAWRVEMEGAALKPMAFMLHEYFNAAGGENYVECTITHPEKGEEFLLHFQRQGKITPHQRALEALRKLEQSNQDLEKARRRIAELETELERYPE